ncbi:MAG: hypothetical protein ACOX6Y_02585 [Christensenellales bacterium]
MKRIFRNAALVLLALILLTSQAAAQVAKDEVVYALLSAGGEVKNIYVVNGFEAPDQSDVSDYGAYSETQPLTQAESFSYQEGEAAFTMAPGRFFYQGTPEGKQLPWDIAITYTLDGKEAAPEALSGAEGKLGIAFSLKPTAEGAAISRSLAMTVTVTLDGKRALNIQADKGTLAYAGGNVTVSYVILPGQEAAYEITADVKDFAMAGMQFAAVRMGGGQGDVPEHRRQGPGGNAPCASRRRHDGAVPCRHGRPAHRLLHGQPQRRARPAVCAAVRGDSREKACGYPRAPG